MSLTVYRKILLLGGDATALDGIDGAILLNLDECTVYQSGVAYTYILNATSGAADDGLNTIAPDTNPGTKRWILQSAAINVATATSVNQVILKNASFNTIDGTTHTITVPIIPNGQFEVFFTATVPASAHPLALKLLVSGFPGDVSYYQVTELLRIADDIYGVIGAISKGVNSFTFTMMIIGANSNINYTLIGSVLPVITIE